SKVDLTERLGRPKTDGGSSLPEQYVVSGKMAGSSLFFVNYRSYRWKMTTCFCISVDVFGVYTLLGLLSPVLYADCDKDYPEK
ncbi:MAG: hypothetical protein ACTTIA_06730, partial [Candidatus Cryptobacteroides sp.]